MSAVSVQLPDRRATRKLAQALAPLLRGGDLVVLSGPLGSGKTFWVRALCRKLKLPEGVRVTSPTFSLVHEYPTEPRVLHADLYRVTTTRDLEDLGLLWGRVDGALVLVEWGAPHLTSLGGDALCVHFGERPRHAELEATGPRSLELIEQLCEILANPPKPTRAR